MYLNSKTSRSKKITVGIAHVLASFNNTIITVSDFSGSVIAWSSAGVNGFKGARKSTPHAATVTATAVAKKVKDIGVKTLSVVLRGPGSGRDPVVRALKTAGINITTITDKTPIPHNGCRAKKRRRV